ncbi:hypothetical protein RP20_CCG005082 [Aedes albopictus]|nr:hypothetical protein RP20_CCG005082 [Aedes albopictus]
MMGGELRRWEYANEEDVKEAQHSPTYKPNEDRKDGAKKGDRKKNGLDDNLKRSEPDKNKQKTRSKEKHRNVFHSAV